MKSIQLRAVLTAAAISLLAPSLLLLAPATARAGAPGWRWPVSGAVITGYRNGDDPYAGGQHRGIDIAAAVGTPVVAAVGGTVSYAGLAGSSGLTVAVRTADGRLETSYLHLSAIAVRAGEGVEGGDRLGAVGTTGRRSAAEPHLHFGVREADNRFAYHDPLDFLPPLAAPPGLPAPAPVPVPVGEPARPDPSPAGAAAPSVAGTAHLLAPAVTASGHAGSASALEPLLGPAPAASAPAGAGRAKAPAASGSHAPRHVRAGSRARGTKSARAVGGHAPAPRPMAGPHPTGHGRSPSAARQRTTVARARPVAHPGGGIDPGWLVACAGLVLAALVLGKPKGPARAGRECRTLLIGAVRPARR